MRRRLVSLGGGESQTEIELQSLCKNAFASGWQMAHSQTMTAIRVPIRVKPGASRTRVGGCFGERLVVAVRARAVDGKATEAALAAIAEAVGVKRVDITLIAGASARDKVVQIDGDVPVLRTAIERLCSA